MEPNRRNLLIGGVILGGAALAGVVPPMCSMIGRHGETNMNATQAPQRPSGSPKPLLEEDLSPVLSRLEKWFADHLDPARYRFNPPATTTELDRLEQLIGRKLPSSYRQLYLWHDGEEDDRWGHIYGLPIIPLARVASEWQLGREIESYFKGNRYPAPAASWPAGAIDPAHVNSGWIALTADGSGNSIGIDLDPWPEGRIGQVIIFGRDEDVKVVLAESLGGFLEWIADLLEAGNFRLKAEPGEELLRQFRLKTPPADHFHEGARQLLGAPGPFL